MSATEQEPKPQQNDNPAIWTLVLEDVPYHFPRANQGEVVAALRADMHAKDDMGAAKYGTRLQAGNGRNPWTVVSSSCRACWPALRRIVWGRR